MAKREGDASLDADMLYALDKPVPEHAFLKLTYKIELNMAL